MAELAMWSFATEAEREETGQPARARVAPGKVTLTQRLRRRGPRPGAPATLAELQAELGAGTPIDAATAARLGPARGADVGGARLHQGEAAAARARELGAAAFTVGPHVVLGAGVDVAQPAGEAVLAHELVHVAQQADAARALDADVQPIGDERAGDELEARDGLRPSSAPGLSVQRLGESENPEGGSKFRTTPPWPQGPMTDRKKDGVNPPLADYLAWLRAFEQAYGVGPATVQRLRRLYYSEPTKGAGGKFDDMIDTEDGTLPTSPPLAQGDLDRLYETNAVTTPQGALVDLSHVFVLFDLTIAGTSLTGGAADLLCPLAGLFSWTGDLASWFVAWLDGSADGAEGGRGDGAEGPPEGAEGGGEGGAGDGAEGGEGEREITQPDRDEQTPAQQLADLEQLKDTKCAAADLMGNIDAHAMSTSAPLVAAGTQSMADLLDGYYGAGAAGGADRRFQRFLVSTQPPIPHVITSASPLTVTLAPGAADAIYAALYRAVQALRVTPVYPLEGYTHILQYITQRFVNFLTAGLAGGSSAW